YGAALYPAMGRVLRTLQPPLSIIGTIVLIFYVSELFWREQRYRVASIIDATPASGATLLAAKVATIIGMTLSLIVAGVIPALALQLARGPEHINLVAYLVLFASSGLPLIVFGVAVLLINALSPGKYAGMVFSLLFAIVTGRPGIIGLEHPLWEYGTAPPVRHSEVSGFGYDLLPFAAFSLFWIAVAALFFLIAATLWRALALPVRERVRFIARIPKIPAAIALIISVAIGAMLFANIDVEDIVAWRVDYEKSYGHFASKPQPRIAAIDANVDLFDRRVHAGGRIELVNTTRVPISRVLVGVRRDAKNVKLSMAGGTVRHDARFGMYDVSLAQPLQPGAHADLQFDATFVREFFASDSDDAIATNGSFLMSFRILPTIGYRRTYELEDPVERRKRGLPPRMELIEGDIPADAEDIRFAATISTPLDQTAIAPGDLERTWTRDGRRYARFTQPVMRNFFAIGAGRFAMQKRMHGKKPIELYYEPTHAMNAKEMLDVVAKSLEYCETNFGPYRPSRLRLAEVPTYWNFGAVAMPNSIFLTEDRTFLIDTRDKDRPDLLGRRIAHEVAHQWWGYEVAPSSGPGATFIVESFAQYTELMVLEQLRGREHVRRLLDVDRDRYLAGRANDETGETPLLRARNQAHIYYGKGSMVLHAIRDLLGEANLNTALRAFVAEQSTRHGLTKPQDLMPHLRRVANDEQYALIEQWLGDIVLYDFAIASAEVKNGAITARVKAVKMRADAEGNETPLPIREAIDMRVIDEEGKTLYE
ncbi:MAG TPA: M1 family aminopeptidase, partial [Thermoanaerobaculia bacterium]